MRTRNIVFLALCALSINPAWADEKLTLQKVTENVYAIVGDLSNRTSKNLGNNATFGVVVTSKGVVLVDSGGTYNGAKAIDLLIKTITDKPIVKIINSGGQDHRWLGNDYFKKQGVQQIIASEAAVKDQKARVNDQFFMLGTLVGEKEVKLTNPVHADKTFKNNFNFKLGETEFEIHHVGQAHTPGDSFIWLPQKSVMFTGDIVYTERILGILDHSNSKSWLKVFAAMKAFKPTYLIPGHGHATTLEKAEQDTYSYLTNIRSAVTQFIDNDGDISEVGNVDQSKFTYLFNFDNLAGRNAQQVFTEMEWE